MLAIRDHEGWYPIGVNGYQNGSRSYRHHNPGNLRKSPFECNSVDNFSVFSSDHVGYMALHWDLLMKAKGQTSTGLGPKSTIAELLYKYAPPSDNNDTEAYIEDVCKKTGLSRTTTLDEIFSM